MFQAVFAWAKPLMDLISAGFDALGGAGARRAARRAAAELHSERRDLRRRQRHRVPAADPDPVPVHPAARRPRLHGARRLPDGSHHGQRGPARPRLHSAAVELRLRHPRHHGDAGDRQPARSADHHPGRAADDLLGAHPGLHADHLGVHSRPRRSGASSACRGSSCSGSMPPASPARSASRSSPSYFFWREDPTPPFMLELPDYKLPRLRSVVIGALHPRQDFPAARRHHHLRDDGADLVPGLVPAAARRAQRSRRSTTASPP